MIPVVEDAGALVPAWFALLVVGIPMLLSAICFLLGHTVNASHPRGHRYREMIWDRFGWFLLGASGMAGGLMAWWIYT